MKHYLAVAVAIVCASVACSGNGASSPSTIAASAPVTTETFTGTVGVGGTDSHTFTVTLVGQLSVILTAAGPPPTIYMGIGLGNPTGSTCTLLASGSAVAPAGSTAQLSGTVDAGTYCVSVYDAGNQTADVDYSVTVNHY
jgi:hypothetical protein